MNMVYFKQTNALGVHESNHTTDANEKDADEGKDTEFGENGSMHEERKTRQEYDEENDRIDLCLQR